MKKNGKLSIGEDFQGWPIEIQTLKDILIGLGFSYDGELGFTAPNKDIINAYPKLLTDDGMGYGVNQEWVTEADGELYEETITAKTYGFDEEKKEVTDEIKKHSVKVFNIFRDVNPYDKNGAD